MAIAPSPTAEATRFTFPDRTSPTANTPGRLVSSICALRASGQGGRTDSSEYSDQTVAQSIPPRGRAGTTDEGSPGIDIVLDLNRFDGVAEHLSLDLTVGLSEAVMLPLVFGPRVDFEALQVGVR